MEEWVKKKRGHSIWSLLVVMTLLAVWLAVSVKRGDGTDVLTYELFVSARQFIFWMLVASLVWLLTGRHGAIMPLSTLIILTCLAPWTIMCIEANLRGGNESTIGQLLFRLKIEETYFNWAWYIIEVFGYDC